MSNRIQIRHGSETPTTDNLVSYELGYVHNGALYINDNGVIAQLTQPDLIGLINNGKITKNQFLEINKAENKQNKILVADGNNQLLYRSPNEILADINGFSKSGGTISGDVSISDNLTVNKTSIFEDVLTVNSSLLTNGAVVLKEGVSYGYIDPNEANIPGVKGQIYFVLPE